MITIRSKYGKDLKYGFLLPFFPILPMIAIGMQFLLVLTLFEVSRIAWVYAAFWIGAGILIYYLYARPRQERAQRTAVLQKTELMKPKAEAPYRVLVPVANPDSLSTLLPPAIHAAELNNGKVTLLHIVTVPSPTPLSSGYRYLEASDSPARASHFDGAHRRRGGGIYRACRAARCPRPSSIRRMSSVRTWW